MINYKINDCEAIRFNYLQKDPYQLKAHNIPRKKKLGNDNRCFIIYWVDTFMWSKYNIARDAEFCRYFFFSNVILIKREMLGMMFSLRKGL